MNQESDTMKYLPGAAAVLLGTYLLITLSRWLHSATFDQGAALIVLLAGLIAACVVVIKNT